MDLIDTNTLLDTPINKYKIKCNSCSFPDIDASPSPYFLAKGRDFSGIEIIEADLGNLFVSNRVKQIIEILLPYDCHFQKTFIQDSKIESKWWLAIPIFFTISGEVYDSIPRCKMCNEPLSAHPGSQYKFRIQDFESSNDIIKSKNWYSVNEEDWKKSWIGRETFLSVRLISLLKKVSAKGIYQVIGSDYKKLTQSESLWVNLAIEKIGPLKKSDQRKEIAEKDIKDLMIFFDITSLDESLIRSFENRFKIKSSFLLNVLINAKYQTPIKMNTEEIFRVESVLNWKPMNGNKKLINIAFDDYGNSLLVDPKDRFCPIYYFDHETLIYELTYSSILDIIN